MASRAWLKRIDFRADSGIVFYVKSLGTTIFAFHIRSIGCLVVAVLLVGCASLQSQGNPAKSSRNDSTPRAESQNKAASPSISPGFAHGKAVVRAVRGRGYVWKNGWTPLKVGQILRTGDSLRTKGATSADLFLDENGPVIRMTSNTTLLLAQLERNSPSSKTPRVIHTRLHLQEGRIYGNVKQQASGSTYEISTPAGLALVRGAGYDISSDGFVKAGSGQILFRDKRGETLLKEGQILDRRTRLQ
jgi:hypothetical protein